MISVVIATVGKKTHLSSVLAALLDQSIEPSAYEIIVVDNGDGSSKEIVNEINKTSGGDRIGYIHDTVPGYSHACNRGVLEAHGDIVTLIHDDTIPVRGFLHAIQEAFKNPEVRLVGGRTLPKYESRSPFWMELFWKRGTDVAGCKYRFSHFLSLVDLGSRTRTMNPKLAYGANFSMRRETYIELGGFNVDVAPGDLKRFQGDGETGLSSVFGAKGYAALYEPKAEVTHIIATSRFTMDYLKRRMEFGGISDSFSKEKNYSSRSFSHKSQTPESIFVRATRLIRDPQRLLHWLTIKLILLTPTGRMVNDLSEEYYKKGYDFHQSVYKSDPIVREWIKRRSYMDTDYPDIASPRASAERW